MILLLLTLLDGSAVNLRTDNFNFKIESKYGVMTIPANDLLDAVLIPRRLKREQEAAGIEILRRAGDEAWRIHQQRREAAP